MKKMKPFAIVFPHSEDEFETPEKLREWLVDDEKGLKSDGVYYVQFKGRLRTVGGRALLPTKLPPSIPRGSVVLFRFKKEIHGDAVVKVARNTTIRERNELRKKHKRDYLVLIRFDTHLIRQYPKGAVTDMDLTVVLGHPPGYQAYIKLTPEQYLELLGRAAK